MHDDIRGVGRDRLDALLASEAAAFRSRNPKSQAFSERAGKHWLNGVPMHWMADWGTPFSLFMTEAQGIILKDADGHEYIDFCLGDTGAMFGHSPEVVAEVIATEARRGLTTMLPSPAAAEVGEKLSERFGLPYWQVTATASDANRSVIRWARGVTGRPFVLVINGCYHGAVDDTFAAIQNGRAQNRAGLVGEARDVTATTKVVEFNDLAALERALKDEDVALVLLEPVMTNCGMVLPDDSYHSELRRLTRKFGTLLAIDETHTISSGPAGYTGAHGLEPDFFVLGKPISGGLPAAVYGWTADVQRGIARVQAEKAGGYSGIGTTLSGNPLQLAAMRVVLDTFLTEASYARAMPVAEHLEAEIARLIAHHHLPWHVVRAGLRVEFVCSPERPCNGTEAGLIAHNPIERALHLYAINRGVLITPFHNMLLVCPDTTLAAVERLISVLDQGMAALTGQPALHSNQPALLSNQ